MKLIQKDGIPFDGTEFTIGDLKRKGHDTAQRSHSTTYVIAELRAIASLRKEFSVSYKEDSTSLETKDTWQRLMNLYTSLNVVSALEALGARVEDLDIAA